MSQFRRKSYKKLIPLDFKESKEHKGLLFPSKSYDIADVALITKQSLKKVKSDYKKGLYTLLNIIKAYNLITKYEKEDLTEYYCKENIEEEWNKVYKFFQYIPYIGIEEYMILRKHDSELLNNLKLKIRGDVSNAK